ncbi:MAG: hypothetical protein V1725_04370 [archaeon]
MARIHEETIRGITTRYVQAQDGIRIYLLPGIPTDAGELFSEKNFDLESALAGFPDGKKERARAIGKKYAGRQLDALSVLLYAEEQGTFDEYARTLESKQDFSSIHPDLMLARTDVTAFFLRLYADLDIAPVAEAERAERQLSEYGVGVVIHPKR